MKKLVYLLLLICLNTLAQHQSKLKVEVDNIEHVLYVKQELVYNNQSNQTLIFIALNNWNNAYSNKNTPLAKRFSDEFIRSFHVAPNSDRGTTLDIKITNENKQNLEFNTEENNSDIIEIKLDKPILPNEKRTIYLDYKIKIPNQKFTSFGFNDKNEILLKNWYLTPARFENNTFVKYNNLNLDDAANAISDIEIEIKSLQNFYVNSGLILIKSKDNIYFFEGKNQLSNSLYIENKNSFKNFKNKNIEVVSNLNSKKVDEIQKAILINKIVNYVDANLGKNPNSKIVISQNDYDQNPFYGLNQLPNFLNPFPNEFLFELKFLKTYLNNYLKTNLQVDNRKDNWIFDAIQVYTMMQYMDENYPDSKMMGSIAKLKLLKSYNLVSLDFNEQFSYFYMLMARTNLDQKLSEPKNNLMRFNDKIASKYHAGLSFKYLSSYIGKENLQNTIKEFIQKATITQSNSADFETILKSKSTKNIDWFFKTIINSRDIIDFKFDEVTKTKEQISFSLINKTKVQVPISIYGLKNKKVVFKEWIDKPVSDSVYNLKRYDADKIVINYENEIPEHNRRNNTKSLKSFSLFNRPLKFNFFKDLEDPKFNQILFVPALELNIYNGVTPGLSLNNKTLLARPFTFDLIPSFGLKSKTLSGSFSFILNQFNRNCNLFNIKYGFSGSTFNYAPDANYIKVNPYAILQIREPDFRNNHSEGLIFRQVYVNREKSNIVNNINTYQGSYSVFNARYSNSKLEITKLNSFGSDLQISKDFGKVSAVLNYRQLFNNNRQVNLRFYAGAFLYNNSNSPYFNFALDRPTDYLFDYNYLGRSESTGLVSQEYIIAEGGFKSKLANASSNQFLVTSNASFNIWNWVEIYGDVGMIKSTNTNTNFVYDSGVRLNLVTDYFELYFPVYSNNGWEIAQPKYQEKFRFIFTFTPNTLLKLFTRKWF